MQLAEARRAIRNDHASFATWVGAAWIVTSAPESSLEDILSCLNRRGLPAESAAIRLYSLTGRPTPANSESFDADPISWRKYLGANRLLASELVQEALSAVYDGRPRGSIHDLAAQIFIAATQSRKLEFRIVEGPELWGMVDGLKIQIPLPVGGPGIFRMILARIGGVCGETEEILIQKGELKATGIEYLTASSRPYPGSPLYLVDARLTVRTDAAHHILRVQMKNQGGHLFFKISRLPPSSASPPR